MSKRAITKLALLLALTGALLLAGSTQALAAVSWQLLAQSNTTVNPHGTVAVATVKEGSASQNEIQRLDVYAGGGSFRLSFGGENTPDLPFDASEAQVQGALEALAAIGAGNVAVEPVSFFNSGSPPYLITFQGALGSEDVPQLGAEEGAEPLAGRHTFHLEVKNKGDSGTDGSEVKLTIALPPGMSGLSVNLDNVEVSCTPVAGETVILCSGPASFGAGNNHFPTVTVAVSPTASGVLTAHFGLEGGETPAPPAASTVDPVTVSTAPPGFGIDAFDAGATRGGVPLTQAAGHPDALTTSFDFNTHTDPVGGDVSPLADARDVTVELPPGLVGSPAGLGRCTQAQLVAGASTQPTPECPASSQVGTALVRHPEGSFGPLPVFNMVPPPGVPARFGFNLTGTVVSLDAHLRSSGDYGVSVTAADIPQGLAVVGNTVSFWGVPSSPAHDGERACPGKENPWVGAPTCPSEAPAEAFFRTPTACQAPGAVATTISADSWPDPGTYSSATVVPHQAPGYPYPPSEWGAPVGIDGCAAVPFEPSLDTSLSGGAADSPAGLSLDIGLPSGCWQAKETEAQALEELCQSDMREAAVTLPQGFALNPAAAGGREACSPAEVGLLTAVAAQPIHFDEAPVSCPDAAKIGTVSIETPLLAKHSKRSGEPLTDEDGNAVPEPLTGSVYLAEQGNNPFGSLLAIYLVAEGSGVVVKQAGEISTGADGQLTTTFREAPQTPFSKIHVELFGGPRAALRTPAACGTYQTRARLTPWSGNGAVELQSALRVDQRCGAGFDPKLQAGTENPLAGASGPFNLRLSREDGSEELGGLQVALPPGLVSSLRGYSYCPEATLAAVSSALGSGRAEEASPSCPHSSLVGSVTVGAGAGPDPFYTTAGRAYLAGPYKGAPLSLAVIAPAVAGPFDLGSVLVRNAIRVDPTTAQITIDSDPLPTIVHGVPLDLRDVRVHYNQTLNPTSCEPLAVGSRITSTSGALASPSVPFQATGCDRLGFKPRLSLSLSGPTHRAAHPRLRAVLRARPGDANIGAATVLLPRTELLENAHIRTICTRVQFNAGAGGGAGCPKGSVYGYAKAWSPILDQPLQGPVYLRSNGGERELPDLVAALGGQIHVDLLGYIDAVHARIRNRFAIVPDAPVSKFELTMQGGSKGLLANNTDICRAKPRASVQFTAHNGKLEVLRPLVKAQCGKGAGRG